MEKGSSMLTALPRSNTRRTPKISNRCATISVTFSAFALATFLWAISTNTIASSNLKTNTILPFYSKINRPVGLCTGEGGKGSSYSGYIGLKGDSTEAPKRSFYWLFEAQNDAQNAPIRLTFGGGPGTTGMMNPLLGQSHCKITANGTIPNPNAWTEKLNLLALDHPIGAGFSYGTMVNNSRSAAHDVYDFLHKFFLLYPHLAKNKFVIASGSYGGIYSPHIATVIHEQNQALVRGEGRPGAVHINLDSLMISDPMSDYLSHYRWALQQRCYNTNLYNSTACTELFSVLPSCLESIQFAYEDPSVENRHLAQELCQKIDDADTNGTAFESIKHKCDGSVEDCYPEFAWISTFFDNKNNRKALGVPDDISFNPLSEDVNTEFSKTSDRVQQAYLLYEPLLKDGIRLLHYVGKLDCNCGWPGIFSFLKLLRTPFQREFIDGSDQPWPTSDVATVRVVGEGAGNMTFILMTEAGHFVTKDQPTLVKSIVEHWVDNVPFM